MNELHILYYADTTECFGNGLLELPALKSKALLLGSHYQSTGNTQWLFPRVTFSCSTIITSIDYATVSIKEGNSNIHPIFQIWQRSPTHNKTYSLLPGFSSRNNGIMSYGSNASNVYRYSGLQWEVKGGDILGVYQPGERRSKTFLSFQNYSNSPYYRSDGRKNSLNIDSAEFGTSFPLLSVEASGL